MKEWFEDAWWDHYVEPRDFEDMCDD